MKISIRIFFTLTFQISAFVGPSFAQVKEQPNRPGHAGKINAVAISSDGKTAASGGEDGTIRIWDLSTGNQLKVLEFPAVDPDDPLSTPSIVNHLAYSPDGKFLAVAHDSGVDVRDVTTWEKLDNFENKSWGADFIAFSPDSKILAAGKTQSPYKIDIPGVTDKPQVDLWDIESVEVVRIFTGVNAPFQFHPSGKSIALSGEEGIVWVKDLRSEDAARGLALKQDKDAVSMLAFDRSGSTLFSVTGGDMLLGGKVRVWDFDTMKIVPGVEIETDKVLIPMPDGKSIAINEGMFASDGLTVVDLRTAQPIRSVPRSVINLGPPAAISRDGNIIVSIGKNGHDLHVIDSSSLVVKKTLPGHSTAVTSIAFSPDGKQVICGYDDESVIRWNASNGKIDKIIEGPKVISFSAGTGTALIAPGGKYYLTESSEYDLFDAETGKVSFTELSSTTNINAAFSDTGRHLVIAESSAVRVYEVASGKLVKRLPFKPARDARIAIAAIAPDGKSVAVSTTILTIRDVASGVIKKTLLGGSKDLAAMSFSPDGKFLAVASSDSATNNEVRVYSVALGKLAYKLPMSTLISDANSSSFFAFSPDGKMLAVKDERDVTINLIDLASGKKTDSIEGGKAFDGENLRIAFSPDGSKLAFGSSKGIRLVDVKTKELVREMK